MQLLQLIGFTASLGTLFAATAATAQTPRLSTGNIIVGNSCPAPERMGDPIISDCKAICPAGSLLSIGGCEVTGERPWALRSSKPLEGGWSCSAYDPLSIGNGNAEPQRSVRLRVYANCRSQAVSPAAAWRLPAAGNIIPVVRSGRGLSRQIPFSFRICNYGPIAATAWIYRKTSAAPGYTPVDPRPELQPGKCILVDRPNAVFLANYVSQTQSIEGRYEAFPPDFFQLKDEPFRIVDTPQSSLKAWEMPARPTEIQCQPLKTPNQKTDVYAICSVKGLKARANYRICFDSEYSPPQNNQSYPGTLAPMVLGARLAGRPSRNREIHWNPIAANSCRDIYNWRYGAFLVKPWRTNPDDKTWQPEKVVWIKAGIARLP